MSYPSSVNVVVDGFSGDGQDMNYVSGSNPPAYEKDPNDSTPYNFISLKRNGAGTNWDLVVYHNSQFFQGSRTTAADNPVGAYSDSGSQTADVIDIS